MAAGQGKRMLPLTKNKPKPMVRVAGKPILEHLLLQFIDAEIRDFLFVVGYRHDVIEKYFGDGSKWGCRIEYVLQAVPAGTGDAVLMAEGKVGDEFIVVNADMFVAAKDIEEFQKMSGNVLSVQEVEDISRFGVVNIRNGFVVGIKEKIAYDPSRLVSIGMYKFTQDIFRALHDTPLSPRGEYELPTAMQILIDEGRPETQFKAFVCNSWKDVSYPEDLDLFGRYISNYSVR